MSFTIVIKGNAKKVNVSTLDAAINKFMELRNFEEDEIKIDEFNGELAEIRNRFGRNESLGVVIPTPDWDKGINWIGGDVRLLYDEKEGKADYELVFPFFKSDDPNKYYGKSLAECKKSGAKVRLATHGQNGNTSDSLLTYYVEP